MTGDSECYLFIFAQRNSHSLIEILSGLWNDVLPSAEQPSTSHTVTPSCPETLGSMHSDSLAQSTGFRNPHRLPQGPPLPWSWKQNSPVTPAHGAKRGSSTFSSELWHFPGEGPLRSLMHLWKEISFSLLSHFNIWTAKSCCSAFWVLFCLALYGNFTLNKHYMTVKGMRWLRGSVMGCEAFPF